MNQSLISHVLLAEGNADYQFLLLRALRTKRPDLEVTVVDAGVELLRMLNQHEFDCVVLAYELPDYKAPDLLELARDAFEKCPAVVVASGLSQDEVIETFRHGAVDFVPKIRAIKGDELWTRLEESVGRYQHVVDERRESERRERHLAQLAETDQLTGLNNRHYLNRCWTANRWSNDRRQYLGCVMADLDHFKKINDTFGHAAGDDALKAVATTMRNVVGSDGSTVRWGGEELLAVCSANDVVKLWAWAENLRMQIESLLIESGSARFHVTTTISKRLSLVGCSIASRSAGKRWWNGDVNDLTFGDGYEVLAKIPEQSGNHEFSHERSQEFSRDRRDCQRWMTNRAVQWKVVNEQRIGAGYIVERSLRGMAIRTSQRDACHIGAQIEWSNKIIQQWLGFQRAVVRRRKRTADGRYVIYLERMD